MAWRNKPDGYLKNILTAKVGGGRAERVGTEGLSWTAGHESGKGRRRGEGRIKQGRASHLAACSEQRGALSPPVHGLPHNTQP